MLEKWRKKPQIIKIANVVTGFKKTKYNNVQVTESIYTSLPTESTSYFMKKLNFNTFAKITLLKGNCSATEAKNIQENWKIKFITKIKFGEVVNKKYLNSKKYYVANTDMIIIYDKNTDEIYKVLK